jgi:hypothetical protein
MKAIAGGTHLSLLVLQRFVIPNHNVLRRNHRHRVTCQSPPPHQYLKSTGYEKASPNGLSFSCVSRSEISGAPA